MTYDTTEALIATAMALNSATLVGNPAQSVKDLYEWMRKIEPGSLVVEMTSRTVDASRVGILEKIETVTTCRHMHDDLMISECLVCDVGDEDLWWTETYYWIVHPDGHKHRWYNCDFVRIPRTVAEWRAFRLRGL